MYWKQRDWNIRSWSWNSISCRSRVYAKSVPYHTHYSFSFLSCFSFRTVRRSSFFATLFVPLSVQVDFMRYNTSSLFASTTGTVYWQRTHKTWKSQTLRHECAFFLLFCSLPALYSLDFLLSELCSVLLNSMESIIFFQFQTILGVFYSLLQSIEISCAFFLDVFQHWTLRIMPR